MMDEIVEKIIETNGSHFDVACLIYEHYKGVYRVKHDKWQKINRNGEWENMEYANELYINISKAIYDFIKLKADEFLTKSQKTKSVKKAEVFIENVKILEKVAINCKMVNYKQALIKECKPLFSE